MGFLGGGGGGGQTQTIQPSAKTDNAVQGPLGSAATRMVDAQGAFSSFNPTQLLPNTTMGQIAMPGPNPTIFGQPYNTAIQSPYFGSAQTVAQGSPFTPGGAAATSSLGPTSPSGVGASAAGSGGGGQQLPWDMNPQQLQQMMGMFQQMLGAPGMPQQQVDQLGLGPGSFPATHNPLGIPIDPQPYYNPTLTNYQPNYQASNGATTPGSGNTTPHTTGQQATGSGGSSGTSK